MASKRNAIVYVGSREPRAPQTDDRQQWIKEVAYYKAMSRRFIPGHELVDWLAAEQEVDALCSQVSES